MTPALVWEEIRDAATLVALEPEWWQLWQRAASSTPFQSPAWLLPWWKAFAPGELCVLAGRQGDRLVALAAFYLEIGPWGRRLLPIGVSISDYHDILLDCERIDGTAGELTSRVAKSQAAWEAWELTELAPEAQALRLAPPPGCRDGLAPDSACPVLDLAQVAEMHVHAGSCRQRRAIRLAQNRAARRGTVELAVADAISALPMLEALTRLHRARWERRGESGILADPRVLRFHRDAVPRLLGAGLLRMIELRIAEHTVGVYYGLQHRDRAYGYLIGFDPDYEFESPGTILLQHAIAIAIADGAREFHFLRGQESYKYRWGAVDRWNRRRVFWRAGGHAEG